MLNQMRMKILKSRPDSWRCDWFNRLYMWIIYCIFSDCSDGLRTRPAMQPGVSHCVSAQASLAWKMVAAIIFIYFTPLNLKNYELITIICSAERNKSCSWSCLSWFIISNFCTFGFQASIPFCVVGSNQLIEAKGKKVRGRLYPWGVVEVENPEHNDFLKLRTMLM